MTTIAPSTLPVADGVVTRRWVRRLLRERRRHVIIVLTLLPLVTAIFAAIPAIIGAIVELTTNGGSRSDLAWLVVLTVLVTVLGMVGVYFGRYETARLAESILDELRSRLFDAVVALPASIVESVGTGELVARATGDVEKLSRAARNAGPAVLFSIFESVAVVIALGIADLRLAAAGVLSSSIAAVLGGRWYLRRASGRYHDERQAEANRSASLLEHYAGRSTMWAFGATDRSHVELTEQGLARISTNTATASLRNVLRVSLRTGQGIGLGIVMILGARLLEADALSAGAMTAAVLYMLRLMDPVTSLLEQLDALQDAQAALQRITGVIELAEKEHDVDRWPADAEHHGAIELAGVGFGYEEDRPVLERIDLVVPAAQRLMIVGPSGAGKSTLAGLITGTHRPWSGSVRIGSVDITGINRNELRQHVALVAQETHVFDRSVRDNVTLGRPDADDRMIRRCLAAADATEWIDDLDDGLDTVISDTHPAITPARSQQLNLARLFCLDPPIVVLDEATADLDSGTANRAERLLATALEGRTVVSIAHRLDAAPTMDRIIMIDDGAVVADGTHADLIARPGAYADLWRTWNDAHGADTPPPSTEREDQP